MSKEKLKPKLDNLGSRLELPGGLLGGGAHIELNSNREAAIDGRCTILEYTDSVIRINTGSGIVRFIGKNLTISALTSCSAIINGIICTLDFTD